MPRGSGFVFRHYHLDPGPRRTRFEALARLARSRGHVVALSDTPRTARQWRADAVVGPPLRVEGAAGLLRFATVHDFRELGEAVRAGADAAFLSPIFATRTHPDKATLGPVRALTMARHSPIPIVALGGMDAARARLLSPLHGWAAIDGLSTDCGRVPARD